MSRLGKLPIKLTEGVQLRLKNGFIFVKGPKGELNISENSNVKVEIKENEIKLSVEKPEEKEQKALWGLYRGLINNMVLGVTEGFEKKLEVNGVGFRMSVSGNTLNMSLGFSHPVVFNLPKEISATIEGHIITISGIDKQQVGQIAAEIRAIKPPEPYKGKGIKYIDEIILRKEGKTASKSE